MRYCLDIWQSNASSQVRIERSVVFDDTEGNMQQFAHCCTDYLHRCLAISRQTIGKLPDDRVVFSGNDRRQIQSFSYSAVSDFRKSGSIDTRARAVPAS